MSKPGEPETARPLRAGVIGCGAMGQMHFNAYSRLEGAVEVAGLCDLDAARLAAAAEKFPQAHTTADYRELFTIANLDLLSICTMPNTHCDIAVAALEAGAHVLCEKPFAMDMAQADRMLAAAARVERHIQVGTNMRHMSQAGALRDIVASGAVGKPVYIRAWTYFTDIPWYAPHIVKCISAGGALASTAIHILDVALWVAGSPDVVAVAGSTHKTFPHKRRATAPTPAARDAYDVEDIAAAHIRLANGATLILEGTWAHERKQSHYSFEMICEKGTLTLDPVSVLVDEAGEIVDRTPEEFKEAADGWGASVNRELERFATAIRTGGAPAQSPREIRNLQRIQDAIYESAHSGREVRFDE